MMGGTCAFGVFNHFRVATFNYGYAGVGRTQVNTNDFAHLLFLYI
jgi:hypothetical protein